MQIDLNLSTEEILNQWAKEIQENNPEISFKTAKEFAKKTMPYLECPMNDNERVPPMRCMFCPYGHMIECHHPFTCDEAECSHYSEDDYEADCEEDY